jgi:iron(III) transport system permease protein
VAALQQIDPSLDEASTILGADAQYTFRKVTLPLILPALLAGLIFSFTRHMTSLSAIIFLVSARWRIVTASILSEWEQGGVSVAAAYSTVIIIFVMLAIGILYLITNKLLRGRGDIDMVIGCKCQARRQIGRPDSMYLSLDNIVKIFPPRGGAWPK